MEMTFPIVYKQANDGMSPLASAKVEHNDVKLPKQKHPQKPDHR
jgi:hypothetical protein